MNAQTGRQRISIPKPGLPGRCNIVGPCDQPVVARIVTSYDGRTFSDDACVVHLHPYTSALLGVIPSRHLLAIVPLTTGASA